MLYRPFFKVYERRWKPNADPLAVGGNILRRHLLISSSFNSTAGAARALL
ncbi:hypothetical protein MJ561_22920 [Klebsiella pneumoniae]|nr:hypothetical protein MJ561_22920 [Klebsiella pneumoniae]